MDPNVKQILQSYVTSIGGVRVFVAVANRPMPKRRGCRVVVVAGARINSRLFPRLRTIKASSHRIRRVSNRKIRRNRRKGAAQKRNRW